ncbi:uncharacterized protein K444DRAFT_58527 [Hyaloscypha bicolor E]|uniref:Myb-like DNA-binding domain-containing protein n=1 Tax=Hyaloscypha bicolor E TaxID=1095630 RepID=A0A2J6SZV1_9HELO|nr:uncharacterized protein K444DRAFT_58527 [Hyaloscypha bicolor E]PMD56282.1 hypothetical protein K444DRAFT_58527 [Hyaloscypha bicolor E]
MSQDIDTFSSPSSKGSTSPLPFFQTILVYMKNKPEVDWNLVAEKAGYKTGNSARTRYQQLMRKFTEDEGGMSRPQAMSQRQMPTFVTGSITRPTPSKNGGKVDEIRRKIKKEEGFEIESDANLDLVEKERGSAFGKKHDSDSYVEESGLEDWV